MSKDNARLPKDGKLLLRAIDRRVLTSMMKAFAQSHNIGAGIFTAGLFRVVPASNHSRLCRLIREASVDGNLVGDMACTACDRRHFPTTAATVGPYRCHCGLKDFAVPIVTRRKVIIGTIFGGQVRVKPWTPRDITRLQEKARAYGIDEAKLLAAAMQTPTMDRALLDRIVRLTEGIAGVIADLVERKTQEHDFFLALTDTECLEDLLKVATRYVRAFLEPSACSIFLRQTLAGKPVFRLESTSSRMLHNALGSSYYEPGEGLTGWVGGTGQPLCITDIHDREELATINGCLEWACKLVEVADPEKIVRYLAVPLLAEREGYLDTVGIIRVVGTRDHAPFDESDVETLQGLAKLIVLSVENAESRDTVRRRTADLEALGHAARSVNSDLSFPQVLQQIITDGLEVMATKGAHMSMYVLLHDPPMKQFVFMKGGGEGYCEEYIGARFADTEGLAGYVMESRRPYVSQDVDADENYIHVVENMKSALVVPIESPEEFLGTLSIGSSVKHAFTDEDAVLLQGFAEHVSIALTNSIAHERAAGRVDLQRKTTAVLTGGSGTKQICQCITEVAAERLNATACSVFTHDGWGKLRLMASTDEKLVQRQEDLGDVYYNLGEGLTGWTATCPPGEVVRVHHVGEKRSLSVIGKGLKWENKFPEDLPPESPSKSFIGTPLHFKGELLGVIRLGQRRDSSTFLFEDESILRELADQGALSLKFASTLHDRELALRGFAHDAGVPVATLFADLTLLFEYADEFSTEMLQRMHCHIEHLAHLVQAYVLIGQDVMTVAPYSDVEMHPMVDRILRLAIGPFAHKRKTCQIINSVPKGLKVRGDKGKLYLLLYNLAKNAAKACESRLTVKARSLKRFWEFRIIDDGSGFDSLSIPSELTPARLGLHISKRFIEAHKGTLTFQRPKGTATGTVAIVRIPRGKEL